MFSLPRAYDLERVAHAAEIELKRVPGTREVQTLGGPGRAVRVLLDADRLSAYGVSALDVRNALLLANISLPTGKLVRENKAILVETGRDADPSFAYVRVSHRGQGLNADDIAQAFQRFQRLSAIPTAGESSTGLGLAIVKAIAEAHGGSVEVTSSGKGRGSTFTLRLPVAGPGSSS